VTASVEGRPPLAPHFNTFEQEHAAAHLGMWIFLATELLLFGGLFTAYTVYRTLYPLGFAEGSRHLDLTLGSVNTIILLVSSAGMALAVDSARLGQRGPLRGFLLVTMILGLVFMSLKAVEYAHHFDEGLVPGLDWRYAGPRPAEVQLFMLAYFTLTGLHAVHLSVAIVILAIMFVRAGRERALPVHHTPFELVGLYWHFVDIIWVFLLPLLYLFGVQAGG
jgi:cytochrome c oxidase subunit III